MNGCTNQTVVEVEEGTEEAQQLYEDLSRVVNRVLIPGVCVFGMVGNILNLTILTRRKLQKSFRTLEQAANLCLISLAVSDLMFCVFVFPHMFLPADGIYEERGWLLSYKMYCAAVINIFIMESTLLTVAMSLERYLACCFPLRQDLYLTTRRIKYVIVFTVIFSVGFNIPVFWRYEVVSLCASNVSSASSLYHNTLNKTGIGQYLQEDIRDTPPGGMHSTTSSILLTTLRGRMVSKFAPTPFPQNSSQLTQATLVSSTSSLAASPSSSLVNSTLGQNVPQFISTPVKYSTKTVLFMDSELIDTVYRILWACFGNLLPLLLLFYFNVCLCRKIYKSYKMRRQFKRPAQAKSSSHTLTITLVVIVVMFFILVAPSEIVLHVSQIANSSQRPENMAIEVILNLMQAINFSANFILYCIISPHFRKTLKYLLLCGCYNIYQVSQSRHGTQKEIESSLMKTFG